MPMSVRASRLLFSLLLGVTVLSACGKEDSASLLAEAKTMLAVGDVKSALIQLKNAVAQDEKNAEARFALGKLYLEQGNLAGAEKEFRRARAAGYSASEVDPLIARALFQQREYQGLLDEFPAPVDPDAATLQSLRALAELALGQKDTAHAILQDALKHAPDSVDVHLALARLALADNDAGNAMRMLEQALQIDPAHRDTLLLKGDLLRTAGKATEAAASYRKVLEVYPLNVNAWVALANIAIAGNKLADARKAIDTALKTSPDHLQARYTLALIDFRENKNAQARDHLAAVLKAAPTYVPALLLGGAIEYALGNVQTAESHLNKAIKIAPGNLYGLRLLAATQLRLGRTGEAAQTLAPALNAGDADPGVLLVAGEIELANKNYARASAYFEQAAQRSPDSAAIRTELGISRLAEGDHRAMADLQAAADMAGANTRADNFIILNRLQKKEYDAALTSIAALEKKQSASPLVWNYRGTAYLGKHDTARSRDSFTQALRLDPGFFPAAANLAQLDLKAGRHAAARQRFEGILKADPRHLNAMLALADLALLAKDDPTYLSWLEKAASIHPQALQPRIALSRYQLAKGDKSQALASAREAVNAQPDNPVALDLLGTTQLALGDITNALGSYRKLVEKQPNLADPLVKLASAQITAKDNAAARLSLQNALRIQPDFIKAALMLGSIEIQDRHFAEAHKLARHVQHQKPGSPDGYLLEGDTDFARKDYPAAITAFEQAQKTQPSATALVRLAAVLNAAQRPEEAEQRLLAWLASKPQDAKVRTVLAENLVRRGQYKAASEHYLFLNKHNPHNLLILNNLAWSLHRTQDARALPVAEEALKLKPDNPAVLDTLGWILVEENQVDRGIKLLQQALVHSPDATETQFHLAAAFARAGDHARASRELERLLASGRDFPQKPAARALLQQLESKNR